MRRELIPRETGVFALYLRLVATRFRGFRFLSNAHVQARLHLVNLLVPRLFDGLLLLIPDIGARLQVQNRRPKSVQLSSADLRLRLGEVVRMSRP